MSTPEPDQVAAPRRGRPGHDQETVLRQAIELFNAQGYDGTSMGDLAKALGQLRTLALAGDEQMIE